MSKLKELGGNNKFIVLNREKVDKSCDEQDKKDLQRISDKINSNNEYLVVNLDEPYAEEVIEILKKHGHWG